MHSASALPSTLLLAAFACVSAPAWADQSASTAKQSFPAQASAKSARSYRYIYYPEQTLYYATEQQIWFWKDGETWLYGVNLPRHFRGSMGTGLPLRLTTTRPFHEHAYVEQRYGHPWREQQARAAMEAAQDAAPDDGGNETQAQDDARTDKMHEVHAEEENADGQG